MVGNHDRQAAMMQVFPEAQLDQDGHLQFVIPASTPIVCLDTLDEGVHDGWICEKRLAWLDHQLGQIAGDYILALHHPPFPVGIPSMDQISLRNPDQLWAVIQDRKPVQMLMGHIHRPIGGVWRGIPLHIQRATNHQVAFDEHKIERIPDSSEAPDFSKVIVSEDTLLIHQISYQASQISYYLN